MILVFGGTTEGRLTVKTLDEGEGKYFYSTYGNMQEIECAHGSKISGAMSADSMSEFCVANDISLIIDAAHPFASRLRLTIEEVSQQLKVPVIRYERNFGHIDSEKVILCDNYDDAIDKMRADSVTRLLALTGVQTIPKLKRFWQSNETYFRILDRDDSRDKATDSGFPLSNVVYYTPDSTETLIKEIKPDAIITKESGISGGMDEKIAAADGCGIKIYVVKRPKTPNSFISVNGPRGLRRTVEKLLPEFYPLHTGFTTGSCATAAAKAALIALLTGRKVNNVDFKIPEGETMNMPIESVSILSADSACATVIKDAGDDPDVTDKCEITVEITLANHQGIKFIGGEGIGTVTLPGLGLPVGEPAINPVPRKMIAQELTELYNDGLDVTISLKGGVELAEKTFNPRVGVTGGVSIIGTTGIVSPYSHEAFVEAIRREMNVAKAMNCSHIIVNSGARSENAMKTIYGDLPWQSFIHYGNAIGETMAIAEDLNVPNLTIGLMIGKAVKLAEGNMDTHSHKITLNKTFLQQVAAESGCTLQTINAIADITLARELWGILPVADANKFFMVLLKLCHHHCAELYHGKLESVLISDEGQIKYIIK